MFSRDQNNLNNWTIACCHVPGFPVPVVGLMSPLSISDDQAMLFIGSTTVMHVRRAEITSRHVTFAEFYRRHAYTVLGEAIEAALPSSDPVDLFLFLAAADYCLQKRKVREDEIQQATKLVVSSYRDLRQQIEQRNRAVAN